ncbi:hypothetical protein QQF64_031218 [Cirrhinus molitorella]|uniref:Uncharacterized protein n=1 Tax=Cirrhinus molitorella TaxID=172907 RepID=A0ABR3MWC0_9TELE
MAPLTCFIDLGRSPADEARVPRRPPRLLSASGEPRHHLAPCSSITLFVVNSSSLHEASCHGSMAAQAP